MSDSHKLHAKPEVSTQNPKRRRLLLGVSLFFIVIVFIVFIHWLLVSRFIVTTDDAYVSGNIVPVSAQTTGRVIQINAKESNMVQAGQVVIELDPTEATVALNKAAAALANAVRQVVQLNEQVLQTTASLQLKQTQLEQATYESFHKSNLMHCGVLSEIDIHTAKNNQLIAAAAAALAQSQLQEAEAQVAGTTVDTHPLVREARANFLQAFLNLRYTQIISPVTGLVAQRAAQIGDLAVPGSELMTIVPLNDVWVSANFKESQIQGLRIGQKTSLQSMLYGKRVTYTGTVYGVNPGTGSSFSVLPAQNATGNWIKIIQRVPVLIKLLPEELEKNPLLIGLSMTVSVKKTKSKQPFLPITPQETPVYTTTLYDQNLQEAMQLISTIIQENTPYELSAASRS